MLTHTFQAARERTEKSELTRERVRDGLDRKDEDPYFGCCIMCGGRSGVRRHPVGAAGGHHNKRLATGETGSKHVCVLPDTT